jgi:hypothetical protein
MEDTEAGVKLGHVALALAAVLEVGAPEPEPEPEVTVLELFTLSPSLLLEYLLYCRWMRLFPFPV